MKIEWKTWIIIVVSIMFGFTMGFIIDIPNTITFDVTNNVKESMVSMESIMEEQREITKSECPIRLSECEKLSEIVIIKDAVQLQKDSKKTIDQAEALGYGDD